ncbi:S-methyl-5-thioribose-1-phosphate isomerase [Pseudomonas sp. gcc21]|uniref:S-methyl-5-thioribose-1-phosphate isomerase n=1 Tax=Pseudomonas sp. gcc21 TaxID=2726989 RepID=UPI00145278EA|nr:S-methyl-5-thioribose-1-phosphate isomerase [Pseudomonas sp. gcc21]QJD57753.1 S-methyl-5-thioribose-1-phosphate isomerase [Pseudomonas sp. gcc21]
MQSQEQLTVEASISAIEWSGGALRLLDQRALPEEVRYLECLDAAAIAEAIRSQAVRGGSLVGIAAAYGVALAARSIGESDDWAAALADDVAMLEASMPDIVQPSWALRMMQERTRRLADHADVPGELLSAAMSIHHSDIEANLTMGKLGAQLIRKHQKGKQNLMTHSNAGALTGAGYGTALGVVRAAHAAGLVATVYVNETRPELEGARLTEWELTQLGVPAQVAVDSAAAHHMKSVPMTWVVVGAERIAANGDVISAMGTYALAILAMHHGLRFMVVAPSSIIDMGLEIDDEVASDDPSDNDGRRKLSDLTSNPQTFDVTPADLVDVIVTEKGLVERPDATRIADLMSHRRLH